MRHPPTSDTIPSTWIGHKNQGKAHFQREDYPEALASYRAALSPEYECPDAERQIILSNVVACRLHIGGAAQARAAVEDAKQCVGLNSSWAKGHVRLAEAYIALGDHSNDACNELQRALVIDPGNPHARKLLTRQLRRDRLQPSPSTPRADDADTMPPPRNPDYDHVPINESPPPSTSSSHRSEEEHASSTATASSAPEDDAEDYTATDGIDESLSWKDHIRFQIARVAAWYDAQSNDVKTVFKVMLVIMALYVAFGGRFGLGSVFDSTPQSRGNYDSGNAYDNYHGRTPTAGGTAAPHGQTTTSSYPYKNPNDYEYRPRQKSGSRSFHFPDLFDGSIPSMLCLAAFGYVCHRFGLNPFHAIMLLNYVGGNRGRGGGMRHVGMAGMGYGMMRGAGYVGGGRHRAGRRNGFY